MHISALTSRPTPDRANASAPPARVPAGRRISLLAWGLAGAAGLGAWALLFKLI